MSGANSSDGRSRGTGEIEAALNSAQANAAREANPLVVERPALYGAAASGVLAELADLGYRVDGLGRIARRGVRYDDAIPVLVRWVTRVSYFAPLAGHSRNLVSALCPPTGGTVIRRSVPLAAGRGGPTAAGRLASDR